MNWRVVNIPTMLYKIHALHVNGISGGANAINLTAQQLGKPHVLLDCTVIMHCSTTIYRYNHSLSQGLSYKKKYVTHTGVTKL